MWCRFLGGGRVSAQPVCDKRLGQPQAEGLNPSAAGEQSGSLPGTPVSWLPLAFCSSYPQPFSQESWSQPHPTHLCVWGASPSVQSHCYQSLKWKPVKDTRTFWKILPEYGEQRLSPVSPWERLAVSQECLPAPSRGTASHPQLFWVG